MTIPSRSDLSVVPSSPAYEYLPKLPVPSRLGLLPTLVDAGP